MSELKNIKNWKKVPDKELCTIFTAKEIESMGPAKLIVYYDDIDKDFIAECCGMPATYSSSLVELRNSIIEDKLLTPISECV